MSTNKKTNSVNKKIFQANESASSHYSRPVHKPSSVRSHQQSDGGVILTKPKHGVFKKKEDRKE